VSSDTLTLDNPAATSAVARSARPMPLVVIAVGTPSAAVHPIRSTSPGRKSGSPPVNRTSSTPRRETASLIKRPISMSVSSPSRSSQSRPSAGMQ
jgi:hypothetical protein